MSANWEKTETNQGVLTVEVEPEQFSEALDQAFKKVVGKVNVPGFRKGKVPRRIFEARFGEESLYQDALDIVLPIAYEQAVQEAGIEPVDRPELDIDQLEKGKKVVFKATVTVKPEVKLGEYKELEIEQQDFSVSDEQVEGELDKVRERQAELLVIEDEDLADKDTAIIDFKGYIDGEAFDGGSAENHSLEIGSKSFIPGFEEQLIGMSKGEEKQVKVSFPEDYQAEQFQGKEATFEVKLNEIKRKKLPELDDEFAKDVSEFETLDEYKADLRSKLEEAKKQEEDNYQRETIVGKAAENAEVEIPDVMVESEVQQMVGDFEQRLQMQGMNMEMYGQFTGQDEEALKAQFQSDAQKRVRSSLTLEAIVAAENIEVSDDDVEEEMGKLAETYQKEKQEIKKMLESQEQLEALKRDLQVRKAIDFLLENSKTAE